MRVIRLVACALMVMPAMLGAAAAQQTGLLEICRTPGVSTITDGKPMAIPPGFVFADAGQAGVRNPSGQDFRMVRLVLQQTVMIAANARCAAGPALVASNQSGLPIQPDQNRAYQPSGSFSGTMPEVVARPLARFQ